MVQGRTRPYLFIDIWDIVYSTLQLPARLIFTRFWERQRKVRGRQLKMNLRILVTIEINRKYSRRVTALAALFQRLICQTVGAGDKIHGLHIVTSGWLWNPYRIRRKSKGYWIDH